MKLFVSDQLLENACRKLENALESVSDLASINLDVELLDSFEELPESSLSVEYCSSPAAYRSSTDQILVNGSKYFELTKDEQVAVLAHEIGHVVCQAGSLPRCIVKPAESNNPFASVTECIAADIWVCEWGFFKALTSERQKSRGRDYCKILAMWESGENLFDHFVKWHNLRRIQYKM